MNEQMNAAKRDLDTLMHQMKGYPPRRMAVAVWEWMWAQGFEQAHTPTDDEREATAKAIRLSLRFELGWSADEARTLGAVLAEPVATRLATLRRTALQEPSAEPTEAMVEAGAREAFFTDDAGGHIRGGYTWDTIPEIGRQNYRTMVRAVMHAALTAAYETKGEGR